MKKLMVAGLSIFLATSASATMFIDQSLPIRCHAAAIKLDTARADIEDEACSSNMMGIHFEAAGKLIANNDNYMASSYLDDQISDLTYAQALGCPKQDVISWAISEAKTIKKLIS